MLAFLNREGFKGLVIWAGIIAVFNSLAILSVWSIFTLGNAI